MFIQFPTSKPKKEKPLFAKYMTSSGIPLFVSVYVIFGNINNDDGF